MMNELKVSSERTLSRLPLQALTKVSLLQILEP